MRTVSTVTTLLVGFVLAAVLFTGLDRASSEEDAREAPSRVEQSHAALVGRVKRAVSSERQAYEFQLVVLATEAGLYVETFGSLDLEDAAILGRKLHALGDLVGAPAELEEILEDLEEEHEHAELDEDDDHDDHDDHDDEDDDLEDEE